jgi:hypothetical protein
MDATRKRRFSAHPARRRYYSAHRAVRFALHLWAVGLPRATSADRLIVATHHTRKD